MYFGFSQKIQLFNFVAARINSITITWMCLKFPENFSQKFLRFFSLGLANFPWSSKIASLRLVPRLLSELHCTKALWTPEDCQPKPSFHGQYPQFSHTRVYFLCIPENIIETLKSVSKIGILKGKFGSQVSDLSDTPAGPRPTPSYLVSRSGEGNPISRWFTLMRKFPFTESAQLLFCLFLPTQWYINYRTRKVNPCKIHSFNFWMRRREYNIFKELHSYCMFKKS